MKSFGHEHQPENWRPFINANTHSLIAVLLHKGNEIQKLQTPGEHYAAELPENESKHVTKD